MFKDRADAGRQLAKKLEVYAGANTVVLALPRGGIVIGYEVAQALKAPLDIVAIRKIGHPFEPEYAIGAIAVDGEPLLNEEETALLDKEPLRQVIEMERTEAKRRDALYHHGRPSLTLAGKTVIIVDDGVATGFTMRLAVRLVKVEKPERIIVAVPVAPRDAVDCINEEGAGEVIMLEPTDTFQGAIGAHYEHFDQIEDAEVVRLLGEARFEEKSTLEKVAMLAQQ